MTRWLIGLLLLGFVGHLLWPYGVFDLAKTNPTSTSLMRIREKEAIRLKKPVIKPIMIWRDMDQISPSLVHAILLAEDDQFYKHHGFDLQQIEIAVKRNWKKKKYVYGGSTITQQLARSLYLRPRKTILRKIKEAVLTVYLEATLSKARILEVYLNVIEWGPGIYGAEAAADHYFDTPAIDLTTDQAVALASILPSPRRWSPFSEKLFMAQRRTNILGRMQREGWAPVQEFYPMFEEAAPDLDSLSAPEHPIPAPTHDPAE